MDRVLNVPYLDQTDAAPTGCESVTAVMLLKFLGVDIGITEFIDNYLDKDVSHYVRPDTALDKEAFEVRGGVLYGPDPHRCFAGDPYDPEAMGCYAPVIKNALSRVIGDRFEIIDETGREIDELVETYIDGEGLPVVLWATINLRPAVEGPCWKLSDTGEDFTWRSNEHCMLLVGSDGDDYVINDPWDNNGVVRYNKELVRRRHREQCMQAVCLRRK